MGVSIPSRLASAIVLFGAVHAHAVEREESRWQISHFKVEYTIARPVQEVWPVFVNVRRWMTDYRFEPIRWPSNDPIAPGALSKATPLYGAALQNPKEMYYIVDVYEVIPESEIVLWLTVEHPQAFGVKEISAFYHWKLREISGETIITIENFSSRKSRHASNEDRAGDTSDPESYHRYRSASQSWIRNLRTLEKLVMDK